MRTLYTILFYLALPFILLRLFWRSRRLPGYREHLRERFGFCRHQLPECIWVHAVSVGESLAAVPLIKGLQKTCPDIPVVVTHMTPTGAACLKKALGDTVLQSFVPYDFPGAVQRFLKSISPKIAIIMETELWPNLLNACQRDNVPMVLANARLSAKSAKGYEAIGPLTREMFTAIQGLAAQAAADADRFKSLGFPAEKITITGNLKFDLELPADIEEKSKLLKEQVGVGRKIWIAASTHPTEEEIILAAHQIIREKEPSSLLMLVPRHPDRFDTVAALCSQKGMRIARRSRQEVGTPEVDVYLGDTMGELLLMYSVAMVTFVAGSFAQVGGHNMLEPAALNKPILTGPVLFNFMEVSQLLINAKAMIVVQNADQLAEEVLKLFNDDETRQTMGENAAKVVASNRGALQKQLNLIKQFL